MGDLAAPDGNLQPRQAFARRGHCRRLNVVAFGRRGIENHRIGRPRLARVADGFLDCVEIKQARPARNDDQRRGLDGFDDTHRNVRRRVDEHPFDVVPLGLLDGMGDAAFHRSYRQRIVVAQFIPKRERALRIVVNQQTRPRRPVHMDCKVSRQSAFARASLA